MRRTSFFCIPPRAGTRPAPTMKGCTESRVHGRGRSCACPGVGGGRSPCPLCVHAENELTRHLRNDLLIAHITPDCSPANEEEHSPDNQRKHGNAPNPGNPRPFTE